MEMEHEYIHADPGTTVDANYAVFSDPKKPLVIEGIEHKVESIIGKDVRVFLWVDINGLKIVDAHKKVVQWSARLNTIVQWAVRDDYFWCRMLYKKGEQRERGFLTGYSKAVKLKAAMETFVNIHLRDPEFAKELSDNLPDPAQGTSVPDAYIAAAEPLESGKFRDPNLPTKYVKKRMSFIQGSIARVEMAPSAEQVPAEELPENAPPPWAQPYENQQRGSGAQSENMALKQQIKQLLQERESQVRMYEAYKVHTKRLETELEANRSGNNLAALGGGAHKEEEVEHLQRQMEALMVENEALRAGGEGGGEESFTAVERTTLKREKEELLQMVLEKQSQLEATQCQVGELQVAATSMQIQVDTVAAETADAGAAAAAAAAAAADCAKLKAQLEEAEAVHLSQLAAMKRQMEAGNNSEAQNRLQVASRLGRTTLAMREEQEGIRLEMLELKTKLPVVVEEMLVEMRYFMYSQNAAPMEEMKRLYTEEVALRKKLHNELVDLRGNIRVYCRVRPLLEIEKADGTTGDGGTARFPIGKEKIAIQQGGRDEKVFSYERSFKPEEDQVVVFEEIQPLITSVMDGYNVTIFAYGQTGSGKTYTMEGQPTNPGVNIRALGELFNVAAERSESYETIISVSILEIYNEGIYDLLMPNGGGKDKGLEVRHAQAEGVAVVGLSTHLVESLDDVQSAVKESAKHRSTFSTNMNDHSSRSHCMLSVQVTSTNKHTEQVTKSKLQLVDLAGSERLSRTDAEGDRLKEAQAINKSLSALGDVIQALSKRQGHVPFRNSKLTQVLQDSMEGGSKVAMFVNVSPTVESASETVCSLNFASRVRGVELGSAGGAAKTPTAKALTPKSRSLSGRA